MGLSDPSLAPLPTRPRFTWDIRNVPWTHGTGNQNEYAKAVKLWDAFQSKLPDSNPNKISTDLCGIVLQSQLHGRAGDMCAPIANSESQSAEGWNRTVEAIQKRDALFVVSKVYQNFTSLLSMKRALHETFKNFQFWFFPQISKFNSNSSSSKLPEALTAIILLAGSAVDNWHRFSVLAAVSNGTSLDASATTDEYLAAVSYEKVASVLRQCDQVRSNATPSINVQAINIELKKGQGERNGNGKHRITLVQLVQYKDKSKYRSCHKYSHFRSDHEAHGSLKPGARSSETLVLGDDTTKTRKTVTFNMVKLVDGKPFDRKVCRTYSR